MDKSFLTDFSEFSRNFLQVRNTNHPLVILTIKNYLSKFLDDPDYNDISFDGDGYYFGRQITVFPNQRYYENPDAAIEIAYSKDKISIYTHNSDAIVPEFIMVTKDSKEWTEVYQFVSDFLTKLFLF